MRRVLFLLLAALPALALGQTPTDGKAILYTGSNSNLLAVNLAQCKGQQNANEGLSDDLTANLTWKIQPTGTGTNPSFQSGGVYRIYLSSNQPGAGQTTSGTLQTSCLKDANGTDLSPVPTPLRGDITVTGQTQNTDASFNLQDLVSKAGLGCTPATQVNFYVCVQQILNNENVGFAVATISLDRTQPPAPVGVGTTAGDGVLHVSCHAAAGDTTNNGAYKAKATPGDHFSSESGSCNDLRITGLTNDTEYQVVVYRLNANHNPSPASDPPVTGKPIPTNDFWDQCRADHCPEQGGCATGGLAAGLAGAFSILVALRRRKS